MFWFRGIFFSLSACFMFSFCLGQTNDDQDSLITTVEYHQQISADDKPILACAIQLYFQQKYESARDKARSAGATYPDDPDALAWHAAISYRCDSPEEAIQLGKAALEIGECHSLAPHCFGGCLRCQVRQKDGVGRRLASLLQSYRRRTNSGECRDGALARISAQGQIGVGMASLPGLHRPRAVDARLAGQYALVLAEPTTGCALTGKR